jgi:hypothetical protein
MSQLGSIWRNQKGSFSLELAIIFPLVCSLLMITLLVYFRFTGETVLWIDNLQDSQKQDVPVKIIRAVDLARTNIESFIQSKNQPR